MGTCVFLVKNCEKPRSKQRTPPKTLCFFLFLSMISIPFHGFPLPTAAWGAKAILRPPREQACVGDWESATSKKGKKHLSIIKWKFLWEIRGLNEALELGKSSKWIRSELEMFQQTMFDDQRVFNYVQIRIWSWTWTMDAAYVSKLLQCSADAICIGTLVSCCHPTVVISYSSTLLWMRCPKDNMEHMTPDQCLTSQS